MKPILIAAFMLLPWAASAHAVPDDVRIQVFLKPQNGKMTILVRMPANALIDILFPVLPGSVSLDLKQIGGFASAGAQVWIADLLSVYEDGVLLPPPEVLASRISPLTDLSFNSFQDALKEVRGDRLPPDTLLPQDEASVDALLESPLRSTGSDFSFEPRFGRLGVRVTTTVAFLPATGGIRQFVYEGDPELFHLNPGWNQAGTRFVKAGFGQALAQTDNLLFLVCLALVFRRFRVLAPFVTAFGAAQACAIIYSAEGLAPATPEFAALVATLVAVSVVYMAIEVIVTGQRGPTRWVIATASGLVFGSNFWFGLGPLIQFGGTHRLFSLLAYSFGLTLSQAGVLTIIVAALPFALRIPRASQTAVVIAAAIVLHISWHRMIDRAHALGMIVTNSPPERSTVFLLSGVAVAALIVAWATSIHRDEPGY